MDSSLFLLLTERNKLKYIHIDTVEVPGDYLFNFCAIASRLSHKNKGTHYMPEQIKLLRSLVLLGDDHAKALRGLNVYFFLTAPRYFWHEFVTYKLGCEQLGSESTMHSAPKFETEEEFLDWKGNITESYLQKRAFVANYQTLRRIYFARRNHRLPHWKELCEWIETLPYSDDLITCVKE